MDRPTPGGARHIGRISRADGLTRDVYEDPDGRQWVNGQFGRLYGQWLSRPPRQDVADPQQQPPGPLSYEGIRRRWNGLTVWQRLVLVIGTGWLLIFSIYVPCAYGDRVRYKPAWVATPQEIDPARLVMTLGAVASVMAVLLVLLRKPPAGSGPTSPSPQAPSAPAPPAPSAPQGPNWIPGPQVTNHKGGKLSSEADFFAPPPPDIGEVLTADTTLKLSDKPLSPSARYWRAGPTGFVACLIGVAIVYSADVQAMGWRVVWIGAVPVVATLMAWWATVFERSVSYVGNNGVAKIKCRHKRDWIVSVDLFLFTCATELRTAQTRNYRSFSYTNTTYDFTWSNDEGQKVFSLSGSYQNEKGNPEKDEDPFWFAHSAEIIWSWHLLDRAQAQLDANGYIHFRLSGMDYVRLGHGIMLLHVGGKDATISAEEMGGIWLGGGQFTVRHKDAKSGFLGFGRSGVFTFPYASMANARLFFLALEKLMGYKFSALQ